MASPARTSPPFTRLVHPDPATNRVVQDLYDKLAQITQAGANDPSPAPAANPAPSSNLRAITKSYTLVGEDQTISANVQAVSSVLLPPSETVQGRGPFVIHNETGSAASISLGSSRGELVAGVAATSHILAPGSSLSVQPRPGYWITTGAGSSASALSQTTAAGPGTSPGGGPGPPIPAPPVTALPGPSDPLSVIGNYIVFNGQQYIFTAPLTGAGDGYWAVSGATIITLRDTMANLSLYPAANYPVGTLFQATDWLVEYCVQFPTPTLVNTWLYYNGIYKAPIASIPGTLGVNDKNFTFNASDYFHNWIWNGTVWHFTTGGFPAGYLAFFISPAYLPPGALWHLCDGSTQSISQDNGTLVATVLPTVSGQYVVQ